MIVRSDADLERAVADALAGGFDNAGQVCSASSQLIVHRDVATEFTERLVEKVKALRIGPGLEDPDVGPVVSAEQRTKILAHLDSARASGVRALAGGGPAPGFARGYFVSPTVLCDVDAALPIAREEVFGPVVTITTVANDEEALRIANGVPTGLVAGIHTRDVARALAMARRLETGSVWINGWYMGGVQAPTGGTKESGLGRERGLVGVRNFLQIKNVAVRLPGLEFSF